MSDGDAVVPPPAGASAGRLLREARERQGLHIAALAASIKVTPKKLEALETDRIDLLPDATFARALAHTVCRALKIDATPVMALLPPPAHHRLEQVGEGLNARFRDRPGQAAADGLPLPASLAFWATALVLLAALVIYFLPTGSLSLPSTGSRAASPEASTGAGIVVVPVPSVMTPAAQAPAAEPVGIPAAAPAAAPVDATAAAAVAASPVDAPSRRGDAAVASGAVQVQTTAVSWIEVVDGRGTVLLSRLLQPGEEVGVDGTPPFKLKIGNVGGTRLTFRGQPLDLAVYTRDNVARFELK